MQALDVKMKNFDILWVSISETISRDMSPLPLKRCDNRLH